MLEFFQVTSYYKSQNLQYKHHTSTVTCSKSSRNTIIQGKIKSLFANILYETSYWGVSTLAVLILLLMAPGAMSLKLIQVVFLFFFSVKNLQAVIGYSGPHEMFFCCEQIQQQDAGDVL